MASSPFSNPYTVGSIINGRQHRLVTMFALTWSIVKAGKSLIRARKACVYFCSTSCECKSSHQLSMMLPTLYRYENWGVFGWHFFLGEGCKAKIYLQSLVKLWIYRQRCEFTDRGDNVPTEAFFWQEFLTFVGCVDARREFFNNLLTT